MRSLKSLSDKELTGRLRQLVREEQNLTLLILPHIAEVGRRELYLEKAYNSLFEYTVSSTEISLEIVLIEDVRGMGSDDGMISFEIILNKGQQIN